MLIAPFMSCGARMPVYAIFAMAFFPRHGDAVVFALYVIGAVLAILSGLLLHKTLFQGEVSAFVMELPPYHIPALRGCLEHVWYNLKSFVVRAGKVIVLIAVLLSLANGLLEAASKDSGAARERRSAVGRVLTVVLRPMGVADDNWPAAAGLLAGLMAKEAIVGTLEVLYAHAETPEAKARAAESFSLVDEVTAAVQGLLEGLGWKRAGEGRAADDTGLLESMRQNFGGQAEAFAYLLFVLIYSPCVAALIVLGREAGWRWLAFSLGYQTLLAWMVATAYYQAVTFSAAPLRAAGWLALVAGLAAAGYGALVWCGRRQVR